MASITKCTCIALLPFRVFGRSGGGVKTRAAHSGNTPVQQFGWHYLKRQEAIGRPLSPHLSIYKPQLTWLISGGFRIAGCLMSGTLFVGVLVFGFGKVDYSSFIERIRRWDLPRPIITTTKFIVAWTIVFHTLNGIRFMGFDLGKGMDLGSIYRTGYIVLALSTVISLLIVMNATKRKTKEELLGY